MSASIYRRRNNEFGASCDGVADTGHTILGHGGELFTVFSDTDPDTPIVSRATRREAEIAIENDWRKPRT